MDNVALILGSLRQDPNADITELVNRYQLRPTLLDPIISESIGILAEAYIQHHSVECLQKIYTFASVRGYKIVSQSFPLSPYLVPKLKNEIQHIDSSQWQTQYTLLLWLSAAVLVPFELNNLEPKLYENLYLLSLSFLGSSGIQRDTASLLMARLLTRGNQASQMELVNNFVAERLSTIQIKQHSNNSNQFETIGTLQVLAILLDRLAFVPQSIHSYVKMAADIAETDEKLWFYDSTVLAKLWMKILGRTALLDMNSFAEFAVAECMNLLDNKSTDIRMASAKYLGRVSHNLDLQGDADLAGEITQALVFSLQDESVEVASSDYWSGVLLAVAEVARRKRNIPTELLRVLVNDVLRFKALHFIQRRLTSQIGSNVRDTACYVCWSLFRYMNGTQLVKELRLSLYSTLINLACLDSEVNVRRAAAAALQEGYGRFGSNSGDLEPEEMFSIMNKINFQSVSLQSFCYFSLAPEFCMRTPDFAKQLVLHGSNHSNVDIRRMAARAASKLHGLHESLIDILLSEDMEIDTHGKMITLGAIYAENRDLQYRIAEARTLLFDPEYSELDLEANLRLVHIAPLHKARELIDMLSKTEAHEVIAAAEDLTQLLPREFIESDILPLCTQKMNESRAYVACLVRIPETSESVIVAASRLVSPESRALAASRLTLDSPGYIESLIACLNDYAVDKRGDVGSWVREQALLSLHRSNLTYEALPLEIAQSLWRLTGENTESLRTTSWRVLQHFELIPPGETPQNSSDFFYELLFQCPPSMRSAMIHGFITSVGASKGNSTTINGSFQGLIRYLSNHEADVTDWLVEAIVNMDTTKVSKAHECVRTLMRMVTHGYDFAQYRRKVLVIAYNMTLRATNYEPLTLDAVDILQVYTEWASEAKSRLVSMMKTHRNGRVRQRCADALFEVGMTNDILESTDWASPKYVEAAKRVGPLS